MTLQQRIELIDMLIDENPDATIRHYLELAGDVQSPIEFDEPSPVIPLIPEIRKPRKLQSKYIHTYRLRI